MAAALGKKETQLGALQGELDAALAEGDTLQTRFAGVRSEIVSWYDSLKADYAADPDVAAALSLTPASEEAIAAEAAPSVASEGEEAESAAGAPPAEAAAAEADADPVALLKAGIAAVGVIVGKRFSELEQTRSGVVNLTTQEETLRGELGAQAASLGDLSERIAAWVADLRAQFADDPDVLAALTVAQPQAELETGAAPIEEGSAAQAAAAVPSADPGALLSAGIAAVGVALGKRSSELDQVRSGVASLTAQEETLRGELNERAAALDGLSGEIAAWVADLRAQYAHDPDVAAALGLAPASQAAPAGEPAPDLPSESENP
jgi:hypothetical protein